MDKLTLKKLYNTRFPELYTKLQTNGDLSKIELEQILSIGIFLTSLKDKNLQSLGYRLFLLYSKVTKDYKPLYELSINKGLFPISRFIENQLGYSEKYGNLYTEFNSLVSEKFKRDGAYRTFEQKRLFDEAKELVKESQIIVAPTSYGKTELILSFIDQDVFKKICIISPTKSLLAQTKKRIINQLGYRKIITYPEMYNNDDKFIAVLTQERLLRLLQNNPTLYFDLLVVDEAHNLLEEYSDENSRSVILGSVIIICNKRNKNTVCKYLTPFLKAKESLDTKYLSNHAKWYKVAENVKSEMFYFYDLENKRKALLDQYSTKKNKTIDIPVDNLGDDGDIVITNSDSKNIIYLNSPKKLEKFAYELFLKLPKIQVESLNKAAQDLREYVHKDYKLAEYIKKGVVYHHGSIPEPVRYFIEDLYINVPELKMLIANSTLLEGVNIPATKMFILDPSRGNAYLSPSSFKNLVGRVCRFKEIFNDGNGNLKYLLPEIHIVKGRYCRKDLNIDGFVKNRKILIEDADNLVDEVKNPLLSNSDSDEEIKKKAEEILENISSYDVINNNDSIRAKTEVGKLCFENNINIFDILKEESKINEEIRSINRAKSIDRVFAIMDKLFFSKINTDKKNYNKLKRLREFEAQSFYKMLINWRIQGLTMDSMISNIVKYWNSLEGEKSEAVYVGKWGDKTRGGHREYWTDISTKNEYEKINLAIVRLKEEYDFIDNEIIKYIETLYSLELVEESIYLKIKYGTDDKAKITLLNCGISGVLSNLLQKKYTNLFEVDVENSTVLFSNDLVYQMKKNNENGVLISEVKMNVKE